MGWARGGLGVHEGDTDRSFTLSFRETGPRNAEGVSEKSQLGHWRVASNGTWRGLGRYPLQKGYKVVHFAWTGRASRYVHTTHPLLHACRILYGPRRCLASVIVSFLPPLPLARRWKFLTWLMVQLASDTTNPSSPPPCYPLDQTTRFELVFPVSFLRVKVLKLSYVIICRTKHSTVVLVVPSFSEISVSSLVEVNFCVPLSTDV